MSRERSSGKTRRVHGNVLGERTLQNVSIVTDEDAHKSVSFARRAHRMWP